MPPCRPLRAASLSISWTDGLECLGPNVGKEKELAPTEQLC